MPISIMAIFVTLPVVALTVGFVYAVRVSSRPDVEDAPEPVAEKKLTNWERARRTGYWISSIVLAVVFVSTGLPKLGGLGELMHKFGSWGYPDEFLLFIGVTEFFAGILLLVPRTSLYAATYLSVVMAGAVYTHLAFDSFVWALLPLFCLSFLFYIAYEDWQSRRGRGFEEGRPDEMVASAVE